jgi:hypothetical protein
MKIRILAIAALAGLSALGAQAFEGEQNPLPPERFRSTLPRTTVRSQALQPLQIGNGGSGVQAPAGMADRAAVKAGARAVTANGAATYGNVDY